MSISTPEVKLGRIEVPAADTRKTVTLNINIKKYLPALVWVLRARSTDNNRYVLKNLNIDDNGYCCTDGRRLHLCRDKSTLPAGLANGLYDVIIAKDMLIFNPAEGQFPDYIKVIIEDGPEKIMINLEKPDNTRLSATLANITIKILKSLNTINIDFIKDMAGYIWEVSGGASTIKFTYKEKDLVGIVMPLKLSA
jgi:hypothetical protein